MVILKISTKIFEKISKKNFNFFFLIFLKKIKLFRCIVEFQGLIIIKKIEKNEFFGRKTLFLTVFGHFDPKKGQKPRNLYKHHFYFCWLFQKSETNPKILFPSHFFFLCPFFQKSVQKKYDDLVNTGTILMNAL